MQYSPGVTVEILGTAQDAGVPQVNCCCDNCRRARRRRVFRRLPASLGLVDEENDRALMVDATPQFPRQLHRLIRKAPFLRASPSERLSILLTHAHVGHYAGLMYLGKEALDTSGLRLYCSSSLARFLSRNAPWSDLIERENVTLEILNAGETVRLTGEIEATPFLVPHRNENADTLAFAFRGPGAKMLYLPDIDGWEGFERAFNSRAEGCDYLVLDGTFFTGDELQQVRGRPQGEVPHPPVEHTLRLLRRGVLKKHGAKVLFTHFNHTNPLLWPESDAAAVLSSQGGAALEEGQTWQL